MQTGTLMRTRYFASTDALELTSLLVSSAALECSLAASIGKGGGEDG